MQGGERIGYLLVVPLQLLRYRAFHVSLKLWKVEDII